MNAKPRFFVTRPHANPGFDWIDVIIDGQARSYYYQYRTQRGHERWIQNAMSHDLVTLERAAAEGRRDEFVFCKAMKLLRELGIPLPPKV